MGLLKGKQVTSSLHGHHVLMTPSKYGYYHFKGISRLMFNYDNIRQVFTNQPLGQMGLSPGFVKKSFIGTLQYPCVYLLFIASFFLQEQRGVIGRDCIQPTKPKKISIWPFTAQLANPCHTILIIKILNIFRMQTFKIKSISNKNVFVIFCKKICVYLDVHTHIDFQ